MQRLDREVLVAAGDMSGDLTTSAKDVSPFFNYSVQCNWSNGSTPVGTLKLQASNDGVNWVDITDASHDVSGDSGSHMFEVQQPAHQEMRVFYDVTSGDADLDVVFFGKTVN